MTATTEQFLTSHTEVGSANAVALQARDGHRLVLRGVQRISGASLSIAAICLWILPFSTQSNAEMLCKMMVTLVLAFAGAALWQAGTPKPTPELEIDLVRREVRLVRYSGNTTTLVTRRRFHDLKDAQFHGRSVRLWDEEDHLLAELTLPDEHTLRSLRHGLQDAGVIARVYE